MYIRAEEYCKRVFDGTHDSPKPKDEGRLLITSKNILNQELNFKDAYLTVSVVVEGPGFNRTFLFTGSILTPLIYLLRRIFSASCRIPAL